MLVVCTVPIWTLVSLVGVSPPIAPHDSTPPPHKSTHTRELITILILVCVEGVEEKGERGRGTSPSYLSESRHAIVYTASMMQSCSTHVTRDGRNIRVHSDERVPTRHTSSKDETRLSLSSTPNAAPSHPPTPQRLARGCPAEKTQGCRGQQGEDGLYLQHRPRPGS